MMTAVEFFRQFLSYDRLIIICPDIVINIPRPYEYMYGLTSANKLIAIPMKEIEAKYIQYLEHHVMDMRKLAIYADPVVPIEIGNVEIGSILKD